MKKFVLGFILGALLFSIIPASAAIQEYVLQKSDVKIMVDGKEHTDKELPVLNYKGYNYLPAAAFRGICDKIGVEFNWDNAKKEIQITAVGQAPEKEGDNVSGDINPVVTNYHDEHGLNCVEYDGEKYIGIAGIQSFGYIKGFTFTCEPGTFNINPQVQKHTGRPYELWEKEDKSNRVTGTVDVYSINLNTYVKYDFFVNTILPFINEQK